jgi:hypothetical protein
MSLPVGNSTGLPAGLDDFVSMKAANSTFANNQTAEKTAIRAGMTYLCVLLSNSMIPHAWNFQVLSFEHM